MFTAVFATLIFLRLCRLYHLHIFGYEHLQCEAAYTYIGTRRKPVKHAKISTGYTQPVFGVFHIKKTSHPGPLVLRREAWWDLLLQIYGLFFIQPKLFQEKCFRSSMTVAFLSESVKRVVISVICMLLLISIFIILQR